MPQAIKIDTALAAEGLWLAVESIDSPGNLGTIIRTAEAAGVTGIFLLSPNDDPWDPAAVRASMGSLFSQKLVKCSAREFTDWAKSSGVAWRKIGIRFHVTVVTKNVLSKFIPERYRPPHTKSVIL